MAAARATPTGYLLGHTRATSPSLNNNHCTKRAICRRVKWKWWRKTRVKWRKAGGTSATWHSCTAIWPTAPVSALGRCQHEKLSL